MIAFCVGDGVALLDDLRDLAVGADDAAVAEGPWQVRGDHGGGGLGFRSASSSSAFSESTVSSGTSPDSSTTVPVLPSRSGRVCSSAWPVPSCCSCVTNCSRGPLRERLLHLVGAVADDHGDAGRLKAAAVRSTRSMSVRPPILCRTLGSWDFIRVPLPAAKTTTWMSVTREESKP